MAHIGSYRAYIRFRDITPAMENQMENDMETGVMW